MATATPATTAPARPAPRVTSRPATFLQVIAVAAVVAVLGWLAVQVLDLDATTSSQATVAERIDESVELERLARMGQIPAAAYDVEAETTRRLTARGLIPSAPSAATTTVTTSSVDELAETARLVARGLVPAATLAPTGEEAATQSLISKGLLPAGSQR